MTISVQEARKVIGDSAKNYTDLQLEEIVNSFIAIIDLAIDDSLQKRIYTNKTANALRQQKGKNYE